MDPGPSDNDLVRAVRNAVLAVQNAEKALEPLYEELDRAEKAAKAVGLNVSYPRREDIQYGRDQPRITRVTDF